MEQLLCNHSSAGAARAVPSWAGCGPGSQGGRCAAAGPPLLHTLATKLRGFQPGRAAPGSCSLVVRPLPNPGQAAAQAISKRELQGGEKLPRAVCNYTDTFSPGLRYTNSLPNLKEKWLVLS